MPLTNSMPPHEEQDKLDEALEKEIGQTFSTASTATTPTTTNNHDSNTNNDTIPNDYKENQNDLEKQETAHSTSGNEIRQRISRVRSVVNGQEYAFSHPLAHVKTTADFLVDFDGPEDPYRPMNWPMRKKVVTTLLYGMTTMGVTWASSIYSPAIEKISDEFHVGREVSLLGLSLLLVGFGLGPCLWGPASELYGRKYAVLLPYFVAGCFSFATAASKDIQTVLLSRFFTGFFGSAPITNTGGVLSDIWAANQRGNALVGYAMAVVAGPVLGPIVGSAIVSSYLGWRWTEYFTGILMMILFILDLLILDETYPPVLLERKARRLRFQTRNWALHCKHEEWDVSVHEMIDKFGKRPMRMLFTPICFFVALYARYLFLNPPTFQIG